MGRSFFGKAPYVTLLILVPSPAAKITPFIRPPTKTRYYMLDCFSLKIEEVHDNPPNSLFTVKHWLSTRFDTYQQPNSLARL